MAEGGGYCDTHCSNCFSSLCRDTVCPLVACSCAARLHECKLSEHKQQICPDTEVSCSLQNIGCPLRMKRRDLLTHVSVCPANTLVCHRQRVRSHERRSPLLRRLDPRGSDPVQLCCYLHDLALMRRVGRSTAGCDSELSKHPRREELESLLRGAGGCRCGGHQTGARLYDLAVGDSEVVVTCEQIIRRDESEQHSVSHLCLSQHLRTVACPMRDYGCQYKPEGVEFPGATGKCRFDSDACGLVVDWVECSFEVDYDRISCLPYAALSLVVDSLDSLSLRCLSLVSRYMREICYERLYTRGLVMMEWERDYKGGWRLGRKSWCFSRVTKLPAYRLNAKCFSDVSQHLEKCAYYKKERVDYRSLPDKVKIAGFVCEDETLDVV